MVLILASLIGAGGVPPLVGFLADRYSFSFAFGAAGVAALACLLLFGFFPPRGAPQSADDRKNRSTSR
jgi:fucose permease